jgi:hypothetical protein
MKVFIQKGFLTIPEATLGSLTRHNQTEKSRLRKRESHCIRGCAAGRSTLSYRCKRESTWLLHPTSGAHPIL